MQEAKKISSVDSERKYVDCRDYPSQTNCSLKISGEEKEVLRAATAHAVSVHGHKDSPELREQLKKGLKVEPQKTNLYNKSFGHPDEIRQFKSHGHLDVLNFDDGTTIGRGVFEPGWKWSNDVKPIANTKSCEAAHSGYCISGTMVIKMDSGEEFTIRPGEAFHIPGGHDAWVEGNEPCVVVDVSGYKDYAKKAA